MSTCPKYRSEACPESLKVTYTVGILASKGHKKYINIVYT